MTLGENIKRIRKERGMTQKELGEKLNVSQQMIGQYESDTSNLLEKTIRKVAIALDCRIDELLDLPSVVNVSDDFMVDFQKGVLEYSVPQNEYYKFAISQAFNKLNPLGKKEAIKRIEELTEIKKYTEPDNTPSPFK